METIYLDYAATTPVHPAVRDAMLPCLSDNFGNPSSIYRQGQEARAVVDVARHAAATFIGAQPDEIIFTSGGSESNNFALKGIAFRHRAKGSRILVSSVEHHAISEQAAFLTAQGFEVVKLPVDGRGLLDPDTVGRAIKPGTILVSVMHANNEVGTIQPVAEIGRLCREKGVLFHTDAVQTIGHLPVSVGELGVDLLSCAAHKFYGPKGVGFLYLRKGTRITPLLHGGSQEMNLRAGTENTAALAGLTAALEIAGREMDEETRRVAALRDRLRLGIMEQVPDCRLNGHGNNRLPNNLNVSFAYVEGESILLNLDLEGIAASTGSACTSSSLEASEVLLAMGLSHEEAHGSIRFSLGKWTTPEEIDRVLAVLPGIIAKLRVMSPLYPGNS